MVTSIAAPWRCPGSAILAPPPAPERWTAFSLELTYPGRLLGSDTLAAERVFTTDVQVIPPVLPFAGTGCPGLPTTSKLTVTQTGNGTVTSQPPGIDCGAACSADFDLGALVTLTATPAQGSYFAGWSGACTGLDACHLVMDQAKEVSAEFKLADEFADVPADSWAYDYIRAIRNAAITNGCGNNNFCPQGLVTREEMAVFLVRAVEGDPPTEYCGGLAPFSDVDATAWSCPHIKRLDELNITNGCGGTNFCPSRTLSRTEAAAVIVRAIEGEPPENYCGGVAPFNDVAPTDWACGHIKRLVEMKITQGCGNGNYCPNAFLNREEMAAFLGRAFLDVD